MSYLIYGKRTGLKVDGIPQYDKTFRALKYNGVRVTRLADAGEYATKEDALEVLNRPDNQKRVEDGLVVFEIRKSS